MKRLCVLVIALLCALTASAADGAINRVTLNGAAVTVNVTAEADCALTVALYDAAGRMLGVQTREVGATAGADVSVTMTGGIPAGSVAKAFLTGADNKPVCKAGSSSDSGVHAILYADGTLVFQEGSEPQPGREVRETYAVDMATDNVPWRNARAFIYQVDFADKIQPTSTAHWFAECTKLREIKNIKNLDTSNVTNMHSMFEYCGLLETLDVSNFNTANVTDMGSMFGYCGLLETLNVSNFNTANVIDMSAMFDSCGRLTTLDVSHFNTAHVTDMAFMFEMCSALTTLNVSAFNTSNVTDMRNMFADCRALTTLDVSGFNTSSVTDMGAIFADCGALTTLDVSSFNTANVTNMRAMFSRCFALITIYSSGQFVTNQATESNLMFHRCNFLVGENGTTYDDKYTDMEYARIDGGASAPGYFTAK